MIAVCLGDMENVAPITDVNVMDRYHRRDEMHLNKNKYSLGAVFLYLLRVAYVISPITLSAGYYLGQWSFPLGEILVF